MKAHYCRCLALTAALLSGCSTLSTDLKTRDGLRLGLDGAGRITDVRLRGAKLARDVEVGGFWLRDCATGELVPAAGAVSGDGPARRLAAAPDGVDLALEADVRILDTHVAFEGRVVDKRGDADRAVDLVFRVPFAPDGGALWWPDILGPRVESKTPAAPALVGSPQTVLSFSPLKGKRFRLYQPASGGCAKHPDRLWLAEIEAYGRDQNENLLGSDRLESVTCDSSSGKYSIGRVTDGRRNDGWDENWLNRGWTSADATCPHWVEMRFKEDVELARVDVYWCRERFGYASSRKFRLERWDGEQWQRVDAKAASEAPRLGDAEKAQFKSEDPGTSTKLYPFACVTDAARRLGLCLAIPPDAPCAFEIGYDQENRALTLTLPLGISPLPRNPALKSQVPFRFVLYQVDGHWGARDAARRYYALFPKLFERKAHLDGLWLLGDPQRIPNPHHYAYREHGEREVELDELWGIYTCPYVLVGQREFPTETKDYEAAMADFARLDPESRSFYGPALKQVIESSAVKSPDGRYTIRLRRRGGSLDGPAVATFPMNPDPSLFEGEGRKTAARETLEYTAAMMDRTPKIDGIYVDSLSAWGGYRNARRDHFEFADLPLTHTDAGVVVMDNALAHLEFLQALREQTAPRGKIVFGNGIRKRRAWAGFLCDVLGVEANKSVHRDASHYAFFRTIAYHKPFLLLYYYNYPKMELPRQGVSEYVQSAVAFGVAPETRPFGKERERDMDLYNAFIPILRQLGQAGWEPVTHAEATDAEVWLERFGTGEKGLFFTVYNPTETDKTVGLTVDRASLGCTGDLPLTELPGGRKLGRDDLARLPVPAKSLRVIRIGDAPTPPTPPVLAAETVRAKLLDVRRKRWQGQGGLLINGSFEELDARARPKGWRLAAKDGGEVRLTSEGARTGEQCIYVRDADAKGWVDVIQFFPFVDAGAEYLLSAWVRQSPNANGPGRLYFQWRGEKGKISQARHLLPSSEQWTRCEWTMRAPGGATGLSLAFGCSRKEFTELWLDDVDLTPKP